jgi:hypothetical protein
MVLILDSLQLMWDGCPDTPRVVVSCTKLLFFTITHVVTGGLLNELLAREV